MIELFVALIQFCIEVIGQALISIPFDCGWRYREKPQDGPYTVGFYFLVAGGLVGWVLAQLVPALVHQEMLRILSLFGSPLLAGAIGYKIAERKVRTQNPEIVPRRHFWYTFAFTLGLAAVRFAYAK
jgi:hypothetical protein